nr:reverse transcriptase domain-containing protein [Tanacetum cinerariifolium]
MTDNRTMAEMLRAPTEGCAEEIIVPPILAEQFELKHSLINMMTSEQFFELEKENPHNHVRWFNKITSTIKCKDVPNSVIKLILFPFSLTGATRRWLEKEPPRSITTWDDLASKFINEFFPPSRTTNLRNEISNFQQKFDESFHEAWERYKDLLRASPYHGFTELHQLDTFYNALNPADQDSLNAAAGGNLLEKSPQDALTIIKNKSKVRNSRSKPIASPVNACDNHSSSELAKLTHAVNQQTSAVTTAMTAMLKQFQSNPPLIRTTSVLPPVATLSQNTETTFKVTFQQPQAWERYKDLLRACPHHGFTELHQLDTFYYALNPADQDSLNVAAGGNLLEKSPQDALTIIENKSKVRNSRSKPIASPVNACDNHSSSELAKLTHAVNQQTSAVTTAMTAMLKQIQSNPPPAQVKVVEEICVTCGGAHPYYQRLAAGGNTFPEYQDNIQGSDERSLKTNQSQPANQCCDYRNDGYAQTIPIKPTSSP